MLGSGKIRGQRQEFHDDCHRTPRYEASHLQVAQAVDDENVYLQIVAEAPSAPLMELTEHDRDEQVPKAKDGAGTDKKADPQNKCTHAVYGDIHMTYTRHMLRHMTYTRGMGSLTLPSTLISQCALQHHLMYTLFFSSALLST